MPKSRSEKSFAWSCIPFLPAGGSQAVSGRVEDLLLQSFNIPRTQLSCCVVIAAAGTMIDVTASGQNPGWLRFWAGHEEHRFGTSVRDPVSKHLPCNDLPTINVPGDTT